METELRRINDALVKLNPDINARLIDLTPERMDVKTQHLGGLIQFHPTPAMIAEFQNAIGYAPVVLSVRPLEDLRGFLESKP